MKRISPTPFRDATPYGICPRLWRLRMRTNVVRTVTLEFSTTIRSVSVIVTTTAVLPSTSVTTRVSRHTSRKTA